MTKGELDLRIELSHSFAAFGQIKERVVTEALGAPRRVEDMAFDCAVADGQNVTIARCGEDAAIARMAGFFRRVLQGGKKAEIVALVGRGRWRTREILIFGVAGGAYPGVTLQSIDLEAGVIGDHDCSRSMVGVVDGLEAGVVFEGGLVFGGGLDLFEAGKRRERDI